MVGPPSKIKFTYDDYRSAPDEKRYELLDGDLVMVPVPRTKHQTAVLELAERLNRFVREAESGAVFVSPFDVVLSDTDVVQPDVLFVSAHRADIITEENLRGAPDLVIEVLSPSTADRDRGFKRSLYARHGVGEYWIVDPESRTVEVLTLGDQGFVDAAAYDHGDVLISPLLEGLRLTLSEVL